MDQLHINFRQIEKLVNLGYWEWYPDSNKLILSEGFKSLLGVQHDINQPGQFIRFLKQTIEIEHITELLRLLKKVKQGANPEMSVIPMATTPTQTKYFEIHTLCTKQEGSFCISGTIQDVSERTKYNILKEKEARFERKIAEIAARFVNEEDFKHAVTTTLSEIGELCMAGIVALFRIENNSIKLEFIWNPPYSPNMSLNLNQVPPSESNYLIEMIKEQKVAFYHQLEDFPGIATETRRLLMEMKCSSLLISGIQNHKQTVGALVVFRFIKGIKWDFSDIHMVKMASILLSNSIRQKIIYKQLRQSENRLQFALMAGSLGTWELDLYKQSYFYDERFANIFGYSNNTLNRLPEWFKNFLLHLL